MSTGLMCLTCRRYIATAEQPVDERWACACKPPRPSWDGKTPAPSPAASGPDADGGAR